MIITRGQVLTAGLFGLWVAFCGRAAAQTLETETARLLPKGGRELSANYEHQVSSEGTERALPFAIEYGVTNRLEVLVEPVAYTAIRPKVGKHATGPGDIEATLTYLLRGESVRSPAFAIAGELKIPTAESPLIGTDQYDYATYLIASKRFGAFDTHANVAYTVIGEPPGVPLNNTFSFALAAVLHPESRLQWFAEVLGVTATSPETSPSNESSVAPETGGAELNGTLGTSFVARSNCKLSLAVVYDNNTAVLVRPGLTLRFH